MLEYADTEKPFENYWRKRSFYANSLSWRWPELTVKLYAFLLVSKLYFGYFCKVGKTIQIKGFFIAILSQFVYKCSTQNEQITSWFATGTFRY